MAKNINIETIQFKLQDFGKLKAVDKTFNKLNKSLSFTPKQLNESIKSITAYDKRSQRSVNTFNQQIASLRELQNSVAIGGKAYRAFGAEADKLRAQLEALIATQKKQSMMSRLGAGFKAGGGTAAMAAAGRYLPAGAQMGALAGFATGGMAGGVAGAGIGLAIDATIGLVRYSADAAEYFAQIEKLRIALKGVTKDQKTYEKGLQIIRNTSIKLNVPLAASTKQFTTLAASVLGAGGTIEDAEVVFTGVSNAIKATGGNAEDVQSAIRAMSQIFGKGKVSAEELQGQLGERLAGAVVKFAEANGSSLQDLQKDLRDGVVGLDQVIKFAEKLNVDFAQTALDIANSTADAGERLKTTMQVLKAEVGEVVQPIGAVFQKSFADMTQGVIKAKVPMQIFAKIVQTLAAALFVTVEGVRFLVRSLFDYYTILYKIMTFDFKGAQEIITKGLKDTRDQFMLNMEGLAEIYDYDPFGLRDKNDSFGEGDKPKGLQNVGRDKEGTLGQFAKSAFDVAKQAEEAFVNAFTGMEDALVNFVKTGKLNFKDLANSIISDLTRMLIRYAVVQPLFFGIFPKLKPTSSAIPSADGNVFAKNKIVPYAYGGVVDKPTLFPMANGMGLMGEAGAEAIMPLKRGKDGKLGVIAQGGGIGNIVVNVDASGSSVEANEPESAELGKMLGSVIQAELIKQKRPGGLLS